MTLKKSIAASVTGAALMLCSPLLKDIEGIEYYPYKDIAGIWTVCSGITGSDVIPGKRYTQSECDSLLFKHMSYAAKTVDDAVKVDIPVTMRAAMYSFTFNAGSGAFRKSTMLKLINQEKHQQACEQLWKWTLYTNPKTGKKEKSRGLKNRRAVEYEYCIKDLNK